MALLSTFFPNSSFTSSLSFRKHNKPGGLLSFHTTAYNHNSFRCLATQQTLSLPPRNSANYQPTLWSYDFLQSLNNGFTDERYKAKQGNLLEHVRRMIVNENTEPLAKLELIDDVQRLGLGHRFDKEIMDALHTYVSEEETRRRTKQSISLHEAALSFRLLRDHAYHVSPGTFNSVNTKTVYDVLPPHFHRFTSQLLLFLFHRFFLVSSLLPLNQQLPLASSIESALYS